MKKKTVAELRACLDLLNSQFDSIDRLYEKQKQIELDAENKQDDIRHFGWSPKVIALKEARELHGHMIHKVASEIHRRERRKAAV